MPRALYSRDPIAQGPDSLRVPRLLDYWALELLGPRNIWPSDYWDCCALPAGHNQAALAGAIPLHPWTNRKVLEGRWTPGGGHSALVAMHNLASAIQEGANAATSQQIMDPRTIGPLDYRNLGPPGLSDPQNTGWTSYSLWYCFMITEHILETLGKVSQPIYAVPGQDS